MAAPEKNLRKVSFIAHMTRGLIRDQSVRRKMMSALIVVALLMLAAGSTVLQDMLNPRERLLLFIGYWLACAWVTITALLLAVFDVLMVRAQGRAAERQLRKVFKTEADDEDAP